MKKIEDFLNSIFTNNELIKKCLEKGLFKTYKKGDDLWDCQGLIFIINGSIKIFIDNGIRKIDIFNLSNDEYCLLSASCVLNNISFDVNIEFVKNTNVWVIPSKDLEELSEKYLEFKQLKLDIISKRLSEIMQFLEDFAFMPLSNRVLKYIKDNASNNELKITHEELARVVGSSRESISRVLKELKNDNKIVLKRGVIIVCT